VTGVAVAGVGLYTAWGEGTAALPACAVTAAAGRAVVAAVTPALAGERFRRATRECLLAVAAVEILLREAQLDRTLLKNGRTGLVYVTAGAYGGSNRAFIEAAAGRALHFPYTAPSAVPAEVTIEFGVTGPYLTLIGGAPTTLEALAQAQVLLGRGAVDRVLVLAVETLAECQDLYARARWTLGRPLVEAAACALLVPGAGRLTLVEGGAPAALETLARRRAGGTLACAPLVALALAGAGAHTATLGGAWRGARTTLAWAEASA
jgi:3-oxoacyl-(acyl-carrier-protein) synthase